MLMNYPGLPLIWGQGVALFMLLISLWALLSPTPKTSSHDSSNSWRIGRLPFIGNWLHNMSTGHWPLLSLKLIISAIFLLIIAAGLSGSQIPQRNIATLFTWNIWWTGVIITIFFVGSAWCAVCPWNALANWLVKRRLWSRAAENSSLKLRVPRLLRSIWPALFLFIGLTWLELGVGITTNPYATALMALLMVVLATLSLATFEGNAFCRYFCPVGRTIGSYSQLAVIELRPIDNDTCANCTSLECYHGSDKIDPCPTSLVMGRIQQNSYCTSCGNCSQSCPHQNIDWRLRQAGAEAIQSARPHWDEAWFMLGLLALTGFHGITMMPFWEQGISQLAHAIGDSGQLLWSFSIGLIVCMVVIIGFYALVVTINQRLSFPEMAYRRVFATFAFVCLPLAFAYHVAHNLSHLIRESGGISSVIANPFGTNTLPLTMMEMDQRMNNMLLSPTTLHAIQAGLIIAGFLLAVQILRHRCQRLLQNKTVSITTLFPMLVFAASITGFHLWLLMQPMTMRM